MLGEDNRSRRWAVRGARWALFFLVTTLAGQWIIELATQKGVFKDPSGQLALVAVFLSTVTRSTAFPWVVGIAIGLLLGFLGGVRADAWFRQVERRDDRLVIEYRSSPRSPPSLFEGWDLVDPLSLRDAASLWAEVDPNETPGRVLDGAAGGMLRMLQLVATQKEIKITTPWPSIGVIPEGFPRDPATIPDASTVTRAELRKFAEARGDRPRFLFPDAR